MSTNRVLNHSVMDRLSEILERLKNKEKLSIKTLANEYGCDTKTIQRDINKRLPELLSQMGLNLKIEREGKLIKLGGNVTPIGGFEEALVAKTLEKLAEGVGSNFAVKAKKLLKGVTNDGFGHIHTNIGFEDITSKIEETKKIESAIEQKKSVSFLYEMDGSKHEITTNPLKLLCFDGFWYLMAFGTKSGIVKKYYLKNISSLSITTQAFFVPKNTEEAVSNAVNIWFDSTVKPFDVRLWADKEIAKYFERRPISKTQRIVSKDNDGSIEISITITDFGEIMPTIKYWIPNLLVLSPIELKQCMEDAARAFLEKSEGV